MRIFSPPPLLFGMSCAHASPYHKFKPIWPQSMLGFYQGTVLFGIAKLLTGNIEIGLAVMTKHSNLPADISAHHISLIASINGS